MSSQPWRPACASSFRLFAQFTVLLFSLAGLCHSALAQTGLTVAGVTAQGKVYDGTTAATVTGTPALVGVAPEDIGQVSIASASYAFSSPTSGTGKQVLGTFTLTGPRAGAYTVAPLALQADIAPRPLTITGVTGGTKVYDATVAATIQGTPVLQGVVGADDVHVNTVTVGTYATKNVGIGIPIAASAPAYADLYGDFSPATNPAYGWQYGKGIMYIPNGTDWTQGYTTVASPVAFVPLAGRGSDGWYASDTATGITESNLPAVRSEGGKIQLTPDLWGVPAVIRWTYQGAAAKEVLITGAFEDFNVTVLSGDPPVSTPTVNYSIFRNVDNGLFYPYTGRDPLWGSNSDQNVDGRSRFRLTVLLEPGQSVYFAVYGTYSTSGLGTWVTKTPLQVSIVADGMEPYRLSTNSPYVLTGADSGNYAVVQPVLAGDITTRPVIIKGQTAHHKLFDATTAAILSGTATIEGKVDGDDLTVNSPVAGTFTTAEVGTGIAVTPTPAYTLSGADAPNYGPVSHTLSANILPAALTGTPNDFSLTVGQTQVITPSSPSGVDGVFLRWLGSANVPYAPVTYTDNLARTSTVLRGDQYDWRYDGGASAIDGDTNRNWRSVVNGVLVLRLPREASISHLRVFNTTDENMRGKDFVVKGAKGWDGTDLIAPTTLYTGTLSHDTLPNLFLVADSGHYTYLSFQFTSASQTGQAYPSLGELEVYPKTTGVSIAGMAVTAKANAGTVTLQLVRPATVEYPAETLGDIITVRLQDEAGLTVTPRTFSLAPNQSQTVTASSPNGTAGTYLKWLSSSGVPSAAPLSVDNLARTSTVVTADLYDHRYHFGTLAIDGSEGSMWRSYVGGSMVLRLPRPSAVSHFRVRTTSDVNTRGRDIAIVGGNLLNGYNRVDDPTVLYTGTLPDSNGYVDCTVTNTGTYQYIEFKFTTTSHTGQSYVGIDELEIYPHTPGISLNGMTVTGLAGAGTVNLQLMRAASDNNLYEVAGETITVNLQPEALTVTPNTADLLVGQTQTFTPSSPAGTASAYLKWIRSDNVPAAPLQFTENLGSGSTVIYGDAYDWRNNTAAKLFDGSQDGLWMLRDGGRVLIKLHHPMRLSHTRLFNHNDATYRARNFVLKASATLDPNNAMVNPVTLLTGDLTNDTAPNLFTITDSGTYQYLELTLPGSFNGYGLITLAEWEIFPYNPGVSINGMTVTARAGGGTVHLQLAKPLTSTNNFEILGDTITVNLQPTQQAPLAISMLPGPVNLGFEHGLSGWTVTGTYAGRVSYAAVEGQNAIVGTGAYSTSPGTGSSSGAEDALVSTATSAPFTLAAGSHTFSCYQSGGQDSNNLYVSLETLGGTQLAKLYRPLGSGGGWLACSASFTTSEAQAVVIRVVDSATGGWGHMAVDHIAIDGSTPGLPAGVTATQASQWVRQQLAYADTATLYPVGGTTGGAVTYSVVSGGPVTLSGNTVTADTGTGSVVLVAQMAGDANYGPVTSAPFTITFLKRDRAPLAISPNLPQYVAYGDSLTFTVTGAPEGLSPRLLTTYGSGVAVSGLTVTPYLSSPPVQGMMLNRYVDTTELGNAATFLGKALHSFSRVTSIHVNAPQYPQADNLTLTYSGSLLVPETGLYTFQANADDRMSLYINDTAVIENLAGSGSGTLALTPGYHKVLIVMSDSLGGQDLLLRWSGPGVSLRDISADIYCVATDVVATVDGDDNYNSVQSTPVRVFNWQNSAKLPQVITAPSPGNKLRGDAAFLIGATSTSGLPVTLAVSAAPAVATFNSTTGMITLHGDLGTIRVTASQAGDAVFDAAAAVSYDIQVLTDRPTVTLTSNVGTVAAGGAIDFTVNATAPRSNLTGASLAVTSPAAGSYSPGRNNTYVSGYHESAPLAFAATGSFFQTTRMTFPEPGTYVFRADVQDSQGTVSSQTLSVVVTPAVNGTSVAVTAPATAYVNRTVELSAAVTETATGNAVPGTVSYAVVSGPATVANATLAFSDTGTVVIRASFAGTSLLAASSATATITVLPNNPPTALATLTAHTLKFGQAVTIYAQVSDADANLTNLRIRRLFGAQATEIAATNATGASLQFARSDTPHVGTYQYVVDVSDNHGVDWVTSAPATLVVNQATAVLSWSPPTNITQYDTLGISVPVQTTEGNWIGHAVLSVQSGSATLVSGQSPGTYTVTFPSAGTVVLQADYLASADCTGASQQAIIVVAANRQPVVTFTTTGNAVHNGSIQVNLSATDADSNLTGIRFQMLPPGQGDWAGATTVESTVSPTGSIARGYVFSLAHGVGDYVFRAGATDPGGVWVDGSPDVTIPVGKADTAISFTSANLRVGQAYTLNGAVLSAVTSGQVALPTYTLDSGAATLAGALVSPLAEGTLAITARYTGDSRNNPATPVTRTFTVTRNQPPTPLPLSLPATALPRSTLRFSYGATDVDGNLTDIAVESRVGEGPWTPLASMPNALRLGSLSAPAQYTIGEPGTYQFRVKASDDDGLTEQVGAVATVTVGMLDTSIAAFAATVRNDARINGPVVYDSASRPVTQVSRIGAPVTQSGDATLTYVQDGNGVWQFHFTGTGAVAVTAYFDGDTSFRPSSRQGVFIVQAEDVGASLPAVVLATNKVSAQVGETVEFTLAPQNFAGEADLDASLLENLADGTRNTYAGTANGPWVYPVVMEKSGSHQFQGIMGGVASAAVTVAVSKVNTVINFPTTSGAYLGTDLSLDGTVTTVDGTYVGRPTYVLTSGTAATLNGSIVTPVSAGTVSIQATYAGTADRYNAAAPVTQTLHIYLSSDGVPELQVVAGTSYTLADNHTPTPIYGTDLGWVRLKQPKSVTLTVSNVGSGATPLVISNTNSSAAYLSANLGNTTLLPGQTAQLRLDYTPSYIRSEQPYVAIASNDPVRPLFRVPIKAVTYYRVPASNTPLANMNGATHFTDTVVGESSTLRLRHSNSGAGNLSVTSVRSSHTSFAVSGLRVTDSQGASQSVSLPATVPPGSYLEFTVAFQPGSAGYRTGTITTVSNNPEAPEYVIPVAGTGL